MFLKIKKNLDEYYITKRNTRKKKKNSIQIFYCDKRGQNSVVFVINLQKDLISSNIYL